MKHKNYLLNAFLLFAFLLLTGCASGPIALDKLVKGKPYFLENTDLILSGSHVGGDKSSKYVSKGIMTDVFNKTLRKEMSAKGLLTNNPGDAQASLDIKFYFYRSFVPLINIRSVPTARYVIEGHKGKSEMVKYDSGKLVEPWGSLKIWNDKKELKFVRNVTHVLVEKIVDMEQEKPLP